MHSKKAKINITSLAIERTGGMRAIFEISNRLHDLNYGVTITTLAGDYSWFPLKVKVNYITSVPNKRLARALDKVVKAYRGFMGRYTASSLFYLSRLLKINFGVGLDLIPYLAENIPDCDVNMATWYPTAFAVYFSGKGRLYYFVQDFPAMVAEQCGFYGDYCLRMFEASLRLPFYFLTNSTYTRDMVIKCQPDAKVKVIGVGVDNKIFYPRKRKLFEDVKKPKVMVMIRGLKHKGDEVAIKVLNALNKKLPIHALLVGSHQSVWKVFSSIKPEFTYVCLGTLGDEKLATLYSSANLFLYTSYAESFGLPPLEAMACGTPVVTTDCLGVREYAINEYNALIAPPRDPIKLAESVVRLLTDRSLVERLRKNGLDTAKRHTWDHVTRRVKEHFRSILV